MKRFLSFFVALFATTCLWAQNNVITYTASEKLPTAATNWENGLYVSAFNTSISNHTFINGIGTITFSGNVTTIGEDAFRNCSGLTSIILPNGVMSIGPSAFYLCSNLTSISIPNSVTAIGSFAFCRCFELNSITIPNQVLSIGESAFALCTSLTSISIPGSVTSIGNEAFGGCSGLTAVSIEGNVMSIGNYAFSSCSLLTSITIPNSVTNIGIYPFDGCSSLTSVYMESVTPPSVTFGNIYRGATATLYVPCGSASAYAAVQYWNDFLDLEEFGCEPTPEELIYTREDLTIGRFGTICLPKAVTPEDITGARFYSIAFALKNTNGEITSILLDEETSGLQAGKPYLFCATATTMTLNYSGFAVEEPVEANGLVGNLDAEEVNVPTGKYVLSNNQIRKVAGGTATVAQNRAYIDLDNVHAYTVFPVEPTPSQVQMRVVGSSSEATELEDVSADDVKKVLRDGKILILRDGKVYDVLGNEI